MLPEGTRFTGRITLSQHARLFHRGGKLRFTIENVDLRQSEVAWDHAATPRQTAQGELVAVEANPNGVKIDSEGTATATESKTRLLRPVIAALVAAKSLDNDAGKQTASGSGAAPNTLGRSLGGFSGFGLLGTLAARGGRAAMLVPTATSPRNSRSQTHRTMSGGMAELSRLRGSKRASDDRSADA